MKTSDKTRPQSIPKAPTGIDGFDIITGGGLPKGRLSLLLGETGSGKTLFALQTLVNGATRYHEPGILLAFEERAEQIQATRPAWAGTFGGCNAGTSSSSWTPGCLRT